MNINSKKEYLLDEVRDTKTLIGDKYPYKDADIRFEEFDPEELYPIAKYVLNPNLDRIRSMSKVFNIFSLRSKYDYSGIIVSPPIVEVSDNVPVIVDGLHRCFVARERQIPITVVYINGVDNGCPVIGMPVVWDEVIPYDRKPEIPTLLRCLRPQISDDSMGLRQYYRDFSYLGSMGRRPRIGQSA